MNVGVSISRNPRPVRYSLVANVTSERRMMFFCIGSRRRSRYLYLSLISSAGSTIVPSFWRTSSIWNGRTSEVVKISISSASTSISPVGMSLFTSLSARAITTPFIATQYSDLREEAIFFTSSDALSPTTTCVNPYLSRRRMNESPPSNRFL